MVAGHIEPTVGEWRQMSVSAQNPNLGNFAVYIGSVFPPKLNLPEIILTDKHSGVVLKRV